MSSICMTIFLSSSHLELPIMLTRVRGTFGNSLSYASSDATSSAASPQVLNGTIPDNNEIIIMTSTPCVNGNCGYTRPGTVPYRAFPM